MIRAHAGSSRDRALIVEAIGGAGRVVNSVGPFASDDTRVECVVLGSRHPTPAEELELVRELERNMPWVPIIVVTDAVAAVALWLAETGVSEVVRYEDIRAELQSRIKAVRRTAALHSLADEVQRSTLTPLLRAALSHGLRAAADQPVRSVQDG